MPKDHVLRQQLVAMLRGGQAHLGFDRVIEDFPIRRINDNADGGSHTPWQLLEHIRIAQRDILDFIRDPDYESPPWPNGYWPRASHQATEKEWKNSVEQVKKDRRVLIDLIKDDSTDLTAAMPQGEKYTLLRQVLLVADHTAYHLGQLMFLKKMGTE